MKKNCNFAKNITMPQISLFYGIIILMNFADHAPAQFHAWYGDYKVIISGLWVKMGVFLGRKLKFVLL